MNKMTDLKLFVDASTDVKDKVLICQSNADKLGVKNGDSVDVINTDNNLKKVAQIEISDSMLDFAGQFAKNILDDLQFSGVELTIRKASGAAATLTPTVQIPKVPSTQPAPASKEPSSLSPLPSPPPEVQPSQPQPTTPPQPIPQPQPTSYIYCPNSNLANLLTLIFSPTLATVSIIIS